MRRPAGTGGAPWERQWKTNKKNARYDGGRPFSRRELGVARRSR
jgi:hypothetical protein